MRLAIAQINLHVGDITGNVARILDACARARDGLQAHVVVFPELTLTGYPPEDLLLRPAFLAQAEEGLARLAREARGIDVIVGHPRLTPAGLCNSASLLRDGGVAAVYDKHLLPNYAVFDEKRYFVAGERPCVVEIAGLPVGLTLCEDVWQPGPVRRAVAAGARLIINLNASPYHRRKGEERIEVVRQRVAENGVPLVYVNLVGGQDELVFDGDSFVVDGAGALTHCCPEFSEGLYPVEIALRDGRAFPLQTPCPPHPEPEAEVYAALVLGVRDYVEKNRFPGVVLGLSGGIDSALTLCIAVDALGAGRVEAVMMPSRYTAAMSREDAREQARALGVRYSEIAIEPMFEAYRAALSDRFTAQTRDVSEENLQARIRGALLMAVSNRTGRLLLTTGNKSEMAVGYATLYGDMAGGYAAIKDVYKTLVYRLAGYRNARAPVIPRRVIEREPSAELAPDQKDSDSLPPYDVLDPILERYVELDEPVADIVAAGYDEAVVRRVATLVDRNEYKRRQAAPGVRITRRAFGRDRRYPITSGYREG